MLRESLRPKTRRWLSVLAAAGQTVILSACGGDGAPTGPSGLVVGSGVVVTAERAISGVSEVSLKVAGRLIIEQTGIESLTITGDDNLVPLLRSEVISGRLVLALPDDIGGVAVTREIAYRLTVRTLDEIDASGVIPVAVDVTGLDAPLLSVKLGGPSTMTVAGRVDVQDISIDGPADYDGGTLQSRDARVEADGPSRVTLRVSERLSGTIAPPAVVRYCGDPTVDVTGNGALQPLGADC